MKWGTFLGAPPAQLSSCPLTLQEWQRARGTPEGLLSPLPKRWQFLTLVTPEIVWGLGWVNLGYVQQSFGFGLARERSEGFWRHLDLLPPRVGLQVAAEPVLGAQAEYQALWGRKFFRLTPEGDSLRLQGEDPRSGLSVNFLLKRPRTDQSLTVHGKVPLGAAPARRISTVKTLLMKTEGEFSIQPRGGRTRRFSLAQGLAALDFTEGFPPRHTVWKWGSLLGWGVKGPSSELRPIGLNLASGNNLGGEGENALWFDEDSPLLLPPLRFERSSERGRFWQATFEDPSGLIRGELEFLSRGVLENRNHLGVVRSDLKQHYGDWLGWIETPETRYELRNVAGIFEDQDVLW